MLIQDEPHGSFWYLEGFLASDRDLWRSVIRTTPFQVGRSLSVDLRLISDVVSGAHAEFTSSDGRLFLHDLGSTNGTFVNFERLDRLVELTEGDVIHFAKQEFRLAIHRPVDLTTTRSMDTASFTGYLAARSQGLLSMMRRGAVVPHFQPVVALTGSEVLGYEMLSRGELGGGLAYPEELFFLAERLGLERKLSEIFRQNGGEATRALPSEALVFLNTHPTELSDPEKLLDSLRALREVEPRRSFGLEVHESTDLDFKRVERLRVALEDLGIVLVFDDFGRGRSRLLDLAELAPSYVKFDMGLVRSLHHGSRRWQLLEHLVKTCESLDIVSIAEGIETQDEVEVCTRVGFRWGQGFFLGRPKALDTDTGGIALDS